MDLFPKHTRGKISPIVKFRGINFLKKDVFAGGKVSYSLYKQTYKKFSRKFDKVMEQNTLYHSYPLGDKLTFEELLIESEAEITYDLENN